MIDALRTHGLKTVIFFRVVPVLQYTLVNVACGAADVSPRAFVLGTVIGMVPGLALMSLFGEGLGRMLQAATWQEVALVVVALAALLLALQMLTRLIARRTNEPDAPDDT